MSEPAASDVQASSPPISPYGHLTAEQYTALLRPLAKGRVLADHAGHGYIESWDVIRHLNRFFGIGNWSDEIMHQSMIEKIEHPAPANGRRKWSIAYRCTVRLRVYAVDGRPLPGHWDGSAVGWAQAQPDVGDAHDLAIKSSESLALKRAARKLGDQFGLSLYDNGGVLAGDKKNYRPVVVGTLNPPAGVVTAGQAAAAKLPDNDPPVGAEPDGSDKLTILADLASRATKVPELRKLWHGAGKAMLDAELPSGQSLGSFIEQRVAELTAAARTAHGVKARTITVTAVPDPALGCGCDPDQVVMDGQHPDTCTDRPRTVVKAAPKRRTRSDRKTD